jgi:hypothetical protein
MAPFRYPGAAHSRRHGPYGYSGYSEYRDWVRDEFAFRCVFCLSRESWYGNQAFFHLDHAVAQKHAPTLARDYENLLYLCGACNLAKQARALPDPCSSAMSDCLEVNSDGTITAKNDAGRKLVMVLRLDSQDRIAYRRRIIALSRDPEHARNWFRYPEDLPDLRTRLPKGNTKPAGVNDCYFARRERGELEETY